MESLVIWGVTGILITAIFIPYLIKFRRQHQLNMERKAEARKMGIDRPRLQFPFIDMAKCIGCGSCVMACPEGDVLGVIFGKATVINGLRCVGHGYCEDACPVGAIEVGLGDVKERDDIPFTDEFNESNVPGIYIVGELAGLSLIRNAITQGSRAVNRIAETLPPGSGGEVRDVIIIGAGPAGLSASLAAIQYKLNYLVIDQQEPGGTILQYPRKKLVMTQPVSIPLYGQLKKPEYSKEDLLDIWRKIIARHKVRILPNIKIDTVVKENGFFRVSGAAKSFRSRTVVLAMGRRGTPRRLNIPGEDLPKVSYQLVDAQSYRDRHLLVVGGGDSAVEAAIGLARQSGNRVTISYRKEKFFRIKKKNEERLADMMKKNKITALFNSEVQEITGDQVILSSGESLQKIPNDYVFIFAGGIPPFKMLKEMGISFGGMKQQTEAAS